MKKVKAESDAAPVAAGMPERNSFTIEELMFRNAWSRNFVYDLIKHGILRTYKQGKRRRASVEAEREAIKVLEEATAEGRMLMEPHTTRPKSETPSVRGFASEAGKQARGLPKYEKSKPEE